MNNYRSNPRCGCARCRLAGIMGPAVLITLGVLFLGDNLGMHGLKFHNTWPLLLIVIGIIKVLQYTSPDEGHQIRGIGPVAVPVVTPVVTPPPPTSAGELPPTSGTQGENNG